MGDVECPRCRGVGSTAAFIDGPSGGRYDPELPCSLCKATGKIPSEVAAWMEIGREHRDRRVALRISIMQAARGLGITSSELSAMENGRADPERLKRGAP